MCLNTYTKQALKLLFDNNKKTLSENKEENTRGREKQGYRPQEKRN